MGVPRGGREFGFGYIPTYYLLLWLKLSTVCYLEYYIQLKKIQCKNPFHQTLAVCSKQKCRVWNRNRWPPWSAVSGHSECREDQIIEALQLSGQIRGVIRLRVFSGFFEYYVEK